MADDLVTGNETIPMRRKFTLDDVKIGSADTADLYPNQQFVSRWFRYRNMGQGQR